MMKTAYLCFFAEMLRMVRQTLHSKNWETTGICFKGTSKTETGMGIPFFSKWSEFRTRENDSSILLPKTVHTGQGKTHSKPSEHFGGFPEGSEYSGTTQRIHG